MTFEELLKQAYTIRDNHLKRVEADKAKHAEAIARRDEYAEQVKAAITAGDMEAHAEAEKKLRFQEGYVKHIKQTELPFTQQELRSMLDEIRSESYTLIKPKLAEMRELIVKLAAVGEDIDATWSKGKRAGQALIDIVPFEKQRDERWPNSSGSWSFLSNEIGKEIKKLNEHFTNEYRGWLK